MTTSALSVNAPSRLLLAVVELARVSGRTWLVVFAAAGVMSVGGGALFRELLALALDAGHMDALTAGHLTKLMTEPVSALLIVLLVATVLVATLGWTATILVIADLQLSGIPPTAAALAERMRRVLRSFARVDVLLFGLQLIMLQPLAGFTSFSPISAKLAVPPFVIREFLKSPLSSAEWIAITAAMLYVVGRLALAPAYTVVTGQRPVRAMLSSLLATRQGGLALALRAGAIIVAMRLAQQLFISVASPAIGLTTSTHLQAVLEALSRGVLSGIGHVATLAIGLVLVARVRQDSGAVRAAEPVRDARAARVLVPVRMPAAAAIVLALTLSNVLAPSPAISQSKPLAAHPLVIGHRGHDRGGPENTIPGLVAASKLHPDMVEVDMQQTKDGTFVASHDSNLLVLAGKDENISDMTTKQVTSTIIHEHGHTAHIPLMTDYVKRARELGVPLLIELKVITNNFTDPAGDMFRQLEAVHGIRGNMFHSLDEAAVKRMIQLRPDVQVGLTMGMRDGALPTTKVDFYTVEQASVTPQLIEQAHAEGRRVYSWTVNGDLAMRMLLREGIDGLITDDPVKARDYVSRIDGGQSNTVDAVHDQLVSLLTW